MGAEGCTGAGKGACHTWRPLVPVPLLCLLRLLPLLPALLPPLLCAARLPVRLGTAPGADLGGCAPLLLLPLPPPPLPVFPLLCGAGLPGAAGLGAAGPLVLLLPAAGCRPVLLRCFAPAAERGPVYPFHA